ncbi:MAG: divergent polysaccharide deacetylase family protein [Chromatiales bacterium]
MPRVAALLLFVVLSGGAPGAEMTRTDLPAIGIVVDDMGYRYRDGLRALSLPFSLAYSFLPHAPHSAELAARATALGKEVMLHLPMEAQAHNRQLGPGALMLSMTREEVMATLNADLASVPNAIGVNNHMGSLLTGLPERMHWVMATLKRRGDLFFVDSRTTGRTVAARVAREEQVPFLSRDVFLDTEPGVDYVRSQFLLLIQKARQNGHALGLCHPRPDTLQLLEEMLPNLPQRGVRLVRLSELLIIQQRNELPWQPFSSPSPKAARN